MKILNLGIQAKKNRRDDGHWFKEWRTYRLWIILGALFSGLGAFIYFSFPWLSLPFAIFGAYKGLCLGKESEKKEEALRSETDFAKFLESYASFLEAGFNPEKSLISSIETMEKRSSKEEGLVPSYFMKGLMEIPLQFREGRNFDQTLILFSQRFSGGMVPSFIKHLLLGKKQGADLSALSLNFLHILIDQKELREERETQLYSAKREEILLFIMPFVLLGLVRWTGLEPTGGGVLNALVKIICLFLFGLAWKWSQKILEDTGLAEFSNSFEVME